MYSTNHLQGNTKEAPTINIDNLPDDTISDISIQNNIVAVSSWNGSVRIYIMNKENTSSYLMTNNVSFRLTKVFDDKSVFSGPVLSVALAEDATFFWAGLHNGTIVVQALDNDNARRVIPQAHEGAVKCVRRVQEKFMVSAGLQDGKIKLWNFDAEQSCLDTGTPIFCMDLNKQHLVVGLANKTVKYFNFQDNSAYDISLAQDFKHQIRDVSVVENRYSSAPGFRSSSTSSSSSVMLCVSSIDGKTSIFTSFTANRPDQTFKGHREKPKCYAVNKNAFVPANPDFFITAGSDGRLVISNKNNRCKVYENKYSSPITAMAMDNNSLVFATGNDWSKGFQTQKLTIEMKYIDLNSLKEIQKKY